MVPDPQPPIPLPACLPATGLDATPLALLAVLALVLLVGGVIALRSQRARVATVLLPLAALALVFGATASSAPAQAVPPTAKIADFTVSDTWTEIAATVYESEAASPADAASLAQLEDWAAEFAVVPTYAITLTSQNGAETVSVSDDALLSFAATGVVGLGQAEVDAAQQTLTPPNRYGNLTLTLTYTWPYYDQCANALSTVTTWTGAVFYPAPND